MSRAYYLDTDNICNFREEGGSLLGDFDKSDIIFLFYTIDKLKCKALNTLETFLHINLNSIRMIKCEPGKDSLDNCIINRINTHKSYYDIHIIISNDKGYDAAFEADVMVERRGILNKNQVSSSLEVNLFGNILDVSKIPEDVEKDKLVEVKKDKSVEAENEINGREEGGMVSEEVKSEQSQKNFAIDANYPKRLYNIANAKIGRLNSMVGKYIILKVGYAGQIMFFQDRKLSTERWWTHYLDGALVFTSPDIADDTLKLNFQFNPLLVYVTKDMVDKAKQGIYEWVFKSLGENIKDI